MNINATLLGQMITFAVFVIFTLKIVWPIIKSAIDNREKKILEGLEAGKKGHEKLRQAEDESRVYLKNAKTQCDEIISKANVQANKIIDGARVNAEDERKEIISSGYKQIEQEVNKVKLELQKKVAELIISGAEKVLIKSINSKDHAGILDKFVKKL
ncbi:MAG TPA: F0F1 ATP synthase subunit B [Candidatus Azoamicus sp. OHIO1]